MQSCLKNWLYTNKPTNLSRRISKISVMSSIIVYISYISPHTSESAANTSANLIGPNERRSIRYDSPPLLSRYDVFTREINHGYARPRDWHLIVTVFRIDWLSVSRFSKVVCRRRFNRRLIETRARPA